MKQDKIDTREEELKDTEAELTLPGSDTFEIDFVMPVSNKEWQE